MSLFCSNSRLADAWLRTTSVCLVSTRAILRIAEDEATVADVETPCAGTEHPLHTLHDHPLVGQVVQEIVRAFAPAKTSRARQASDGSGAVFRSR